LIIILYFVMFYFRCRHSMSHRAYGFRQQSFCPLWQTRSMANASCKHLASQIITPIWTWPERHIYLPKVQRSWPRYVQTAGIW